jgi:hypothetical protein
VIDTALNGAALLADDGDDVPACAAKGETHLVEWKESWRDEHVL